MPGLSPFGLFGASPPPPPPVSGMPRRGRLTRLTGLWPPFSEGTGAGFSRVPDWTMTVTAAQDTGVGPIDGPDQTMTLTNP